MSDKLFHLMERHQKLDELLRRAQRRRYADPIEITRLKMLKLSLKDRLARLLRSRATAI
jgi:uncharacterized protein